VRLTTCNTVNTSSSVGRLLIDTVGSLVVNQPLPATTGPPFHRKASGTLSRSRSLIAATPRHLSAAQRRGHHDPVAASHLPKGGTPGVLTLTGPLTRLGGAIVRMNISSKFGGEYTQSAINGTSLDLSDVSPTKPIIIEIQGLALSNDGLANIYDADPTDTVA